MKKASPQPTEETGRLASPLIHQVAPERLNRAGLRLADLHPRSVGVAICDHNLRFVTINSALARMNGVPLEKHFGQQIRDILGSASRRVELAFERVLTSEQSLSSFEVRAKLPGRERIGHWIETFHPIKDSMGRVTGVAALVVEITDQVFTHPRLSDGCLIASSDAFHLMGQSEKEMSKQGQLIAEPRWIRRCDDQVASPKSAH